MVNQKTIKPYNFNNAKNMGKQKKDFKAVAADVFVEKMITTAAEMAAAEHTDRQPKQTLKQTGAPYYQNAAKTETKETFMLADDVREKLRRISFNERMKKKQIIDDALRMYLADYEAKHGAIL